MDVFMMSRSIAVLSPLGGWECGANPIKPPEGIDVGTKIDRAGVFSLCGFKKSPGSLVKVFGDNQKGHVLRPKAKMTAMAPLAFPFEIIVSPTIGTRHVDEGRNIENWVEYVGFLLRSPEKRIRVLRALASVKYRPCSASNHEFLCETNSELPASIRQTPQQMQWHLAGASCVLVCLSRRRAFCHSEGIARFDAPRPKNPYRIVVGICWRIRSVLGEVDDIFISSQSGFSTTYSQLQSNRCVYTTIEDVDARHVRASICANPTMPRTRLTSSNNLILNRTTNSPNVRTWPEVRVADCLSGRPLSSDQAVTPAADGDRVQLTHKRHLESAVRGRPADYLIFHWLFLMPPKMTSISFFCCVTHRGRA
jgi:hypothetical protein